MLELDRQRINKQGLGRIVAAFKPDFAFICQDSSCRTRLFMTRSDHHFRSRFQIAQLAVSRDEIAPGSGGADDRRRRRAWFLRGRRHLRAWISRRALGRRLRRSSWLDRRVFCWVDCHVLRFAEFRASGFRANCAEPIMSLPRAALVVLSDPPLTHDPEKCVAVFAKRSCANNKLRRDGDLTQSHRA